MACDVIQTPGGGTAIVCGRRQAARAPCGVARCTMPATRLCDYPTGPRRTCSARLCATHAAAIGGGDLCPAHAERYRGAA